MSDRFTALVFDVQQSKWLGFSDPTMTFVASHPTDLLPMLERLETVARRERLWAVGWLSYEAARGIDLSLSCRISGDFPLAWFALYPEPLLLDALPETHSCEQISWRPSISEAAYNKALAQVQKHIARGDTYQVNFSFRLKAAAPADPRALFYSMVMNQAGPYSMYLDTGRFVVSSASPELFFEIDRGSVVCRPMKGTAARGCEEVSDRQAVVQLLISEKERAENLMIVDMVRNDLSLIAERGSVSTADVCRVEKYPHVLQMTSEVRALSVARVSGVMRALFPAASITGAPKKRTMEIIDALECSPRKIYTGAMGVISPHERAWFNVAIRTALIDRQSATVEYGVGSGVVWDSISSREYQECIRKASAVSQIAKDFDLFETILWEPADGFFLRERHVARLERSSAFLEFEFNEKEVRYSLDALAETLCGRLVPCRVRLLLTKRGNVSCEVSDIPLLPSAYTVSLAQSPVESTQRSLYHKTTDRLVYDNAKPEVETANDVLLWNEREELTESRIATVALDIDGILYTPPVSSGLLPGCYREELLATGELQEKVLYKSDLLRAAGIYLLNSLRRRWSVTLLTGESDRYHAT